MSAEPTATAPAPPYRANAHQNPGAHRTRDSTSTDSSSPIGHTADPTCWAIPGDQAAGCSAAGSHACSTFAATDITEPNTNPSHATNCPPAGTGTDPSASAVESAPCGCRADSRSAA